jgi:hypothetical protein
VVEVIPPYPLAGAFRAQVLLDLDPSRYNTRAWGSSLTARFCSVYDWPVFKCPPRVSTLGAPRLEEEPLRDIRVRRALHLAVDESL